MNQDLHSKLLKKFNLDKLNNLENTISKLDELEKEDYQNPEISFLQGTINFLNGNELTAIEYFNKTINKKVRDVYDNIIEKFSSFHQHFITEDYDIKNKEEDLLVQSINILENIGRNLPLEENKNLELLLASKNRDLNMLTRPDASVTVFDLQSYSNRFNVKDILELKVSNVQPDIANKYHERFRPDAITYFQKNKISSDIANEFDERLFFITISNLIEEGTKPNITKKYDSRFDGFEIEALIKAKVSPKYTKLFPEKFDGKSISILKNLKINPEKIPKYDNRFKGIDIAHLIKGNVSNEVAIQFDERIDGEYISELISIKHTPEETYEFDERFDGYDIHNILYYGGYAEVANAYNKRFTGRAVGDFIRKRILPHQTNEFSERFWVGPIEFFIENKISPKEADEYPERFDMGDIRFMWEQYQITGKLASEYPETFDLLDITNCYENGLTPEKIKTEFPGTKKYLDLLELKSLNETQTFSKNYPDDFTTSFILELDRKNLTMHDLNKRNKKLWSYGIAEAIEKNISDEQLFEYGSRFEVSQIIDLIENEISYEETKEYPYRFASNDIIDLKKNNITIKQIKEYSNRFQGYEIINLIDNKIPAKEANKYPVYISEREIIALIENNINTKTVSKYNKDTSIQTIISAEKISPEKDFTKVNDSYELFLKLAMHTLSRQKEILGNPEDYNILEVGKGSVIVSKSKSYECYKFSPKSFLEYEKLNTIHEKTNSKIVLKPVELIGTHDFEQYMKLEFIKGDSLAQIIKKSNLEQDFVYKIGTQIIDGLIDMRRAGYWYHRDIRPQNIMITEENNVKIIDLEFATTDKKELVLEDGNYRFKGPNDLHSVGQVLYYAATGKHIFSNKKSKTGDLSDIKYVIDENRTKSLESKYEFRKLKNKINKNIKHEGLNNLLHLLFTAKHHDYRKIQRTYQEAL